MPVTAPCDTGVPEHLRPIWNYQGPTVELKPGDLLLLFPEGMTEAMTPDGEEFGEGQLIAAATGSPGQSIDDLQSHLLSSQCPEEKSSIGPNRPLGLPECLPL